MIDVLAPLLDLPGVEAAVAEARDAVDGLLSHRVLRRGSAEVTAESALRGARASAELETLEVALLDADMHCAPRLPAPPLRPHPPAPTGFQCAGGTVRFLRQLGPAGR